MLRIFAIVAAALVVVVAGVLIYAATRPDTFTVRRVASIKAPPARIHALIEDFSAWKNWSPYEKKDPDMKRSLSGAPRGKGAVYEWDGNNQVGKGRMEIVETTAPSRIAIKLDFLKPFEGHNMAEFTMTSQGDTTTVTWAMHGPSPYIAKVMGTFFDMDKMIGTDFEVGLANLKALAEK